MRKILVLLFSASIITVSAQTSKDVDVSAFSVTINPSFYVLGGYSVKAFYHLPERWSFGVAAEAGFELPDFARDQFFDNAEDLTINWDYLWGIEARYRFHEGPLDKGFYILGTLGIEGWTARDVNGLEDKFDNWYGSIGVGYNWYPFVKKHFHLGVAYNVVFILNNTEDRAVGSETYNINGIVPPGLAPNLVLGWRF